MTRVLCSAKSKRVVLSLCYAADNSIVSKLLIPSNYKFKAQHYPISHEAN